MDWGSPGQNTRVGSFFPSPVDLPDLGIEPLSLTSPALAGGFFTNSTSSAGQESACNAGDPGSIPGFGRSPGEGRVLF